MTVSELGYRNAIQEELAKVPFEYLPVLLKMMRAFREGVTLKGAEESFRTGWQEALADETLPFSELWDDIDDLLPQNENSYYFSHHLRQKRTRRYCTRAQSCNS